MVADNPTKEEYLRIRLREWETAFGTDEPQEAAADMASVRSRLEIASASLASSSRFTAKSIGVSTDSNPLRQALENERRDHLEYRRKVRIALSSDMERRLRHVAGSWIGWVIAGRKLLRDAANDLREMKISIGGR